MWLQGGEGSQLPVPPSRRVSIRVSCSCLFLFYFWRDGWPQAQVGSAPLVWGFAKPPCSKGQARLRQETESAWGIKWQWWLLGSVPGQQVETRGYQGWPGKSPPAVAPCPLCHLQPEGFLCRETGEHLPRQLQAPAPDGECPGMEGNPGVCLGVGGTPGVLGSALVWVETPGVSLSVGGTPGISGHRRAPPQTSGELAGAPSQFLSESEPQACCRAETSPLVQEKRDGLPPPPRSEHEGSRRAETPGAAGAPATHLHTYQGHANPVLGTARCPGAGEFPGGCSPPPPHLQHPLPSSFCLTAMRPPPGGKPEVKGSQQ